MLILREESMATKAERYETERRLQKHAGNGAKPATARRRPNKAAASTEADPAGRPHASLRAKGRTYALEVTRTSRPSRKSTRGSAEHGKTDAALSLRRMLKASAPTTRATGRPGRRTP
jgi:hypothetical protein